MRYVPEWRVIVCQGEGPDLGVKDVLLVEEEDEVGADEERVVDDGVEQLERLLHAVGAAILKEDL